jgi:transcription initiation factor TFIIE subunit alpha
MGLVLTPMKLSNKLIEETIADVAGPDVVAIVKLLKNKKNVSEFRLAEMIKEEVNIVRNMLYRLYHLNLVSFTRRKDKTKGWYIYYWTLNPKQLKHVVIQNKKEKLEKLKARLERESGNPFFICENACMRLEFDTALTYEFKCPECGELMQQEDNSKKIKEIEKEISEIEKQIGA